MFVKQKEQENSKIIEIYNSLKQICNVSVKSITDPQYYKNVINFINTAVSSFDFILEQTHDDKLIDITIIDDIFKVASGDIKASLKVV